MADPQSARARAPSDALPTDAWMKLRNEFAQLGQWANTSPVAKWAAGQLAMSGAQPLGVVRGAGHTVQDLVKTGIFAAQVVSPGGLLGTPSGQAAATKVAQSAVAAKNYAKRVGADPSIARADIKRLAGAAYRSVEPSATPVGSTLDEELQRKFNLGLNQGEAAFDIASLVYGGPAIKGLSAFPRTVEELAAMDRLVAASTPRAAARLEGPYSGMGQHFVPRRYTRNLPKFVQDNPFFVYKPNVSQGEMYARHYQLDPDFKGARLPGNAGWSGERLGLKKFGLFDSLAFGMPAPTRTLAIGNAASAAQSLGDIGDEGQWR
jgi:hypothetical protein